MPVYLDYNATAPIRPEAAEAVARALAIGANPSAVHAAGRAARAVIETARAEVAALIGADPERMVFTSGGAEANALGLEGLVAANAISRVIIGATEHPSVAETARSLGLPLDIWPVDANGVADLTWLEDRLALGGGALVALMLANNETGVIQPVAEAARLVHDAGGLIHVDAVQAAGRIPVDIDAVGADTLALSAHKLGGPQGSGALAYAAGVKLSRRLHGGGQERGLRAGTENLSGITGFGAAAKAALRDLADANRQGPWRDAAAERLKAAGAVIAGEGAPRLPNVVSLAAEGFDSSLQVMGLDLAGVMVSAGSACSSGKVTASAVLAAMGMGDLARSALRASGGWATTEDDWIKFADAWLAAHSRWQARRSAA